MSARSATPREPNQQETVRDAMRPALTTIEWHAHIAAAYLMRQAHESALVVTTDHAGRRPTAIITDSDIARAVADGKDVNETHIDELADSSRSRCSPKRLLAMPSRSRSQQASGTCRSSRTVALSACSTSRTGTERCWAPTGGSKEDVAK